MSGPTLALAASSQKHVKSSNRSVKHRSSSGPRAASRVAWVGKGRGSGQLNPVLEPQRPPPLSRRLCRQIRKAPPRSLPQQGPSRGTQRWCLPELLNAGCLLDFRPNTHPPTPRPAACSVQGLRLQLPGLPQPWTSEPVGVCGGGGAPYQPRQAPCCPIAPTVPPPAPLPHPSGKGSGARTQTVFTVACGQAPLTRTRAFFSLPHWRVCQFPSPQEL